MLVTLILLPTIGGLAVWAAGDHRGGSRTLLSLGALAATFGLAVGAAADEPTATMRWGSGLTLRLEAASVSRLPVVMVAFVGLAVVIYALGYGPARGRARMVGLLVTFVGTMELLVLAADLLTLLIAWELVGLVSWGLIAHHWRSDAPIQAGQAFLATRAGDLGLFVAAGAAFAATGTLDFNGLGTASGAWAGAVAAGVVVSAAAKSAQVPFSPWLFAAMAGPTPASALLHSATMVAAGAYLLARLHPFLDTVNWFGPVAIAIGLTTAVTGGVVAVVHTEAKKLLAASTAAHYGLMFVAVGAGYPAVGIAHLIAHGLFKALLFVSAGVAIDTAGTERLAGMRVRRQVPVVAGLAWIGTLALAAVPPLGAGWTKEQVVAAAAHQAPWIAVLVVLAGGLSALYAARFQLVAFGRSDEARSAAADPPNLVPARASLVGLAVTSVALGLLWVPWGEDRLRSFTRGALPAGAAWELAASLAAVAAAAAVAVVLDRNGRLARPSAAPAATALAGWFGLPRATRVAVVDPVLAASRLAARLDDRLIDRGITGVARVGNWAASVAAAADDRVIDAGVRGTARLGTWLSGALDRRGEAGFDGAIFGLARLTGAAGRHGRRLQSGQTHHYYTGIAAGIVLLVTLVFVWS